MPCAVVHALREAPQELHSLLPSDWNCERRFFSASFTAWMADALAEV
tara:strand:+ start:308 stop:448 length:141 start_codon:yes stop_codon:yes gene_type:complete